MAPTQLMAAPRGVYAKLARRPLWQHAVVLLALLTVLIPIIGTRGQFHDDEGAALLQTEMLAHGDGWMRPNQFSEFVPLPIHSPIFGADERTTGYAPYGKHPAYPLLLVPFYWVAGAGGLLFASALGAAFAALIAGGISERLRPRTGVIAFWATAIGSPIFFDGLIVEAHAIAAALAGAAVLATLAWFRRPRWSMAIAAAVALVALGLLRTEGLLFVIALGIAVAFVALRGRRTIGVVIGGAFVVLAIVVRRGEPRWVNTLVHGSQLVFPGAVSGSALRVITVRLVGASTTLIRGGYGSISVGYVLSFLAAVLLVSTAIVVRRHPGDTHGIVLFAGAAAAVFVLRLLLAPAGAIPGLLVACPLIAFGVVVVRRQVIADDPHLLLTATVVLFAAAVLATQYGFAGYREWGWRYFAVALPLAVPLALDATCATLEGLERRARTAVVSMLVVGSVALAGVEVSTLVSDHRASADQAAMVVEQARSGVAGPVGQTVVITTFPPIGRYAWRDLDVGRIAIVFNEDLAKVAPSLPTHGVDRLLFVTDDVSRDIGVMRATFSDVRQLDQRAGVTVFVVDSPVAP